MTWKITIVSLLLGTGLYYLWSGGETGVDLPAAPLDMDSLRLNQQQSATDIAPISAYAAQEGDNTIPFSTETLSNGQIIDYRHLLAILQSLEHANSAQLAGIAASFNTNAYDPSTSVLRMAIIQRWAEVDFHAAAEFVTRSLEQWYESLVVLARVDIEAMFTLLNTPLDDDFLRHALLDAIAAVAPERLYHENAHDDKATNILAFEQWSRQDPQSALDWLLQQAPEELEDTGSVGTLFYEWLEREPEIARQKLESILSLGSDNALLSSPENRAVLAAIYGNVLANQDPQSALSWAQQQTDPAVREVAILAAIRNLTPDEAQLDALLAEAQTPEERELIFQSTSPSLIDTKLRENPMDAIRWVSQQGEDVQIELLSMTVTKWSEQDPKSALAWAENNLPNSQFERLRYAINTQRLYSHYEDPTVVFTTMDEASQLEVVPQVLSMLEPEQRGPWLTELQGPVAELGQQFNTIEQLRQRQPQEALKLALRLPNNAARHYSSEIAYEFANRYPSRFHNWLENADLAERERIRMELIAETASFYDRGYFQSSGDLGHYFQEQ